MSGGVAEEETDPNFNQTVLLLHGDGTNGGQNNTFVDSSSSGHSITRSGNPTQGTFNPFLGEGQYSRYTQANTNVDTHGTGITLGTNNFTIGMFVYPLGCDNVLGQALTSGGSNRTNLYADTGGTTVILAHNQFLTAYSGGVWGITINFTTAIALNQWQWIQVDRTGNTFRVSIDGSYVAGGGATASGSVPAIVTGTFGKRLGQDNYFGYYNNFILINGANRGSITPPSTSLTADSNTALLLHQSNRLVNNGNTSVTLTSGDDNKIVPYSPLAPTASYSESVHGGSGYFDGTNDHVEVAVASSDFNLGTDQFTFEAWIYTESIYQQTVMIAYVGSTDFNIYIHNDAVHLYTSSVIIDGNSGSIESFIQRNAWSHIVMQRDSSNYLTVYVNGVRKYYTVNTTDFGATSKIRVGEHENGSNEFEGYIADVRFVKGSAVYSGATITVPSAPLTSTGSETKLLLNFTNASIIDNTIKNNIETVGNTQIDTSIKKFGTGSMQLDGTGDALRLPHSPTLAMDSGDWTIEFFMYYDNSSFTGYRTIIDQRNSSDSETSIVIYFDGGNSLDFYTAGGMKADIPTSSMTVRTFHHIALVKNGSTTKFYLDGTATGASDTSDTRSYVTVGDTHIGERYNSSQYFLGYLDDFRITKGVARYTTDFTAPTKAFANR